eukprot:scaffold389697_cov17-Prasinocladus_malaysianus.AAC.1
MCGPEYAISWRKTEHPGTNRNASSKLGVRVVQALDLGCRVGFGSGSRRVYAKPVPTFNPPESQRNSSNPLRTRRVTHRTGTGYSTYLDYIPDVVRGASVVTSGYPNPADLRMPGW